MTKTEAELKAHYEAAAKAAFDQADVAVNGITRAWRQYYEGAITLSELNMRMAEATAYVNNFAFLNDTAMSFAKD